MNTILSIRKYLQNNDAKHWQYLFLGFIISISTALFWTFISLKSNINIIALPLAASLAQGFIAYLFMSKKGEARKVFFALLFSYLTFFLGKYLLFEHYYDWYLTAYIDKNIVNWNLIIFYLKATNIESLQLFFSHLSLEFTIIDILWISIITLFSLLYFFIPFEDQNTDIVQNSRKIFRKRRFD